MIQRGSVGCPFWFTHTAAEKARHEAIRQQIRDGTYQQPFSPELYRMAVEMAAPYGYGWEKGRVPNDADNPIVPQIASVPNRPNIVESPGEIGEKAIPYSKRGIEIEPRLVSYMEQLPADGAFISDKAGSYSMEDLQILTAETGVEYTMLTIDGQSYVIRGNDRGTSIPNELSELLYDKQGEFVCHSHPFVGDLNPSASDLNFIKSLTWQTESAIIDPSGEMVTFDKHGVIERQTISTKKDDDYYQKMFGGID